MGQGACLPVHYFRQALGRRVYIDRYEYHAWARTMARYVPKKAIEQGVLI